MEASIMDGKTLNAGAVAQIRNVKNPIHLARLVMEKSDYVYMVSKGAEEFARKMEVEFEPDSYFFTDYRYEQLMEIIDSERVLIDHSSEQKFGTVGAVALDIYGNLAAATSTGGLTNKRYGRLGDSSVIGAGTYANNKTCAVSCTGYGEYFIRSVVAHDISCLIEYKGLSLREACDLVVNKKLKDLGGEGGLIAVDAKGNIELVFNSEGMYRGKVSSHGKDNGVFIYR
jgi:beta-aspartyl-peptidase (threonine type)